MSGSAGRSSPARQPRWTKDAAKYLLPEEQPPVVATRRHWAVLIEPTLKGLPVLVGGGWLLLLDPGNRVSTTAGFLVIVGALAYLALRAGEWWMRHFLVTRRRVLLTSGVIVRTVTLLPLRRITDLTWKETVLGQLLGYGTFRFESAGQQQALSQITFLPRADLLYREVSSLLFGSDWGGASGGDDEGNPEPPPGPAAPPGPPAPPGPTAPPDRPARDGGAQGDDLRDDGTGDDGRRDTEPLPRAAPQRPRRPRVAGRRMRQADR